MSFLKELYDDYCEKFGKKDDVRVFFSPGRVNLIGEHVDYNGGYVFPCCLNYGTYMFVGLRNDSKARFYSKNFPQIGTIEFDVSDIKYDEKDSWVNYPKGVFEEFNKLGKTIDKGFDVFVYGNIPNGAGLSSSASLEVVTSVMVNECFNFNLDMITMVKLSQRAENNFIGVKCGILDQFAVGMCKKNKAVLLNCKTLNYKYANINLKDSELLIINTNKKRGLIDSKYNERRQECEAALNEIRKTKNIKTLSDIDKEEFDRIKHIIKDKVLLKRARHVIYENDRTLRAYEELNKNNIIEFGKLMDASHLSLKNDFEVTCRELDILVELSREQDGAIGSRMTGGGFGGCTVNLVKREKTEEFISVVGEKYTNEIGYEPSFYRCEIGEGAKELEFQ